MLDTLRLAENLHGHAGWLAAAALAHPALLLRKAARRADRSVTLSTLLVTLVGAAGVVLYGPYRRVIKRAIFEEAPTLGWLFERKEHLAFGAIAFAWGGAASYVGAIRLRGTAASAMWWRFAALSFAFSAVLALTSAVLGTIVASFKTF